MSQLLDTYSLVVKEHNGEDSGLLIESKNKKPEPVEIEEKKEVETVETKAC